MATSWGQANPPEGRAYEALGDCISEATKYDQVLTFRLEGRRLHVRYRRHALDDRRGAS
jgi:hypothetical protein